MRQRVALWGPAGEPRRLTVRAAPGPIEFIAQMLDFLTEIVALRYRFPVGQSCSRRNYSISCCCRPSFAVSSSRDAVRQRACARQFRHVRDNNTSAKPRTVHSRAPSAPPTEITVADPLNNYIGSSAPTRRLANVRMIRRIEYQTLFC